MDDNIHWCFDLATGRELWKEKAGSSSISSPVFADGKISSRDQRRLQHRHAETLAGEAHRAWQGQRHAPCGVPSPAIADGKLLLRGRKGISCYSLKGEGQGIPRPKSQAPNRLQVRRGRNSKARAAALAMLGISKLGVWNSIGTRNLEFGTSVLADA